MPHTTYFVQECPTCGRALQIRVEYLGKSLGCPHCSGEFKAQDPSVSPGAADGLIRRAEELLSSVDMPNVEVPNVNVRSVDLRSQQIS